MKKQNIIRFILPLLLLASCSNKDLSRAQAKELIIKELKFPKPYDHEISCGDPEVAKALLDLGLEEQGLITVVKSKSPGELSSPWISFTEKGKAYLLPTKAEDLKLQGQNVKIVDLDFGEILGVAMANGNKAAKVEYTIIYKNPTPFSKIYSWDFTKPKKQFAYFVLYDDGWKYDKLGELSFSRL